MLTEKEKKVYNTINYFINDKKYSPSIRELCNILNYKSTQSINYYLRKLRDKGIISYKNNKSRSISILETKKKILNTNKEFEINLQNNNLVFQIKNNYFKKYFIYYNDFLIIDTTKKIKNNDLGLFLIDKKYRIMQYSCVDNYYVLKDNETIILYHINLIGVVSSLFRIIKKEKEI